MSGKELKIGNITVPYGIMLAPMAGISNHVFRKICREFGVGYTVSEMVSAKALCYDQRCKKNGRAEAPKTAELSAVYPDDYPMAVQLFGSEPDFMSEAATILESCEYKGCRSSLKPAAIDINMGCPVAKVVSNGDGSALMKDPVLCGRIVAAVKKAVSVPVTVKIRAGWSNDCKNAVEVARQCEAGGANAITVHGRTRTEMYSPGIDRRIIADVKRAVSVPVIGNGDIFTSADTVSMLEETGCDGIMVARGALGNPWIFGNIISRFEGTDEHIPSTEERIAMALRHAEMLIKENPVSGLAESRKHLAWYIKGIPGAAAVRSAVMTCTSFDRVRELMMSLILRGDGR